MLKLSLRPYPGEVFVAASIEEYERAVLKLFKISDRPDKTMSGRFFAGENHAGKWLYLVWGKDKNRLAHELSHVILHLFDRVGIDPREASGEPFCYLLSQLLLDTG